MRIYLDCFKTWMVRVLLNKFISYPTLAFNFQPNRWTPIPSTEVKYHQVSKSSLVVSQRLSTCHYFKRSLVSFRRWTLFYLYLLSSVPSVGSLVEVQPKSWWCLLCSIGRNELTIHFMKQFCPLFIPKFSIISESEWDLEWNIATG